MRRDFDEEDVALSAFHSRCAGVKEGKFPRLDDRDNLWSLLASSQTSRSTLKLSDNRVLTALLSEILGRRVIVIREETDR